MNCNKFEDMSVPGERLGWWRSEDLLRQSVRGPQEKREYSDEAVEGCYAAARGLVLRTSRPGDDYVAKMGGVQRSAEGKSRLWTGL